MGEKSGEARGRKRRVRADAGVGEGVRKPTALKGKSARGKGKISTERYPDEALTLFKTRRAAGGQGSSFRAIQAEIGQQFGRSPSLNTLQRWAVRYDAEIRDLQRAVEGDRKRYVLECQRGRLDFLSSIADQATQRLQALFDQAEDQARSGRLDIPRYIEALVKVVDAARREERGEAWDGSVREMGDGAGHRAAEFVFALARRTQGVPEAPQILLDALQGVTSSIVANNDDIAARLGRTVVR